MLHLHSRDVVFNGSWSKSCTHTIEKYIEKTPPNALFGRSVRFEILSGAVSTIDGCRIILTCKRVTESRFIISTLIRLQKDSMRCLYCTFRRRVLQSGRRATTRCATLYTFRWYARIVYAVFVINHSNRLQKIASIQPPPIIHDR